nr:hypothetical protein CFP56_33673 [Quercus suber]POE56707.1 hypothetical protein CFP56_33679 [Quercus suber]
MFGLRKADTFPSGYGDQASLSFKRHEEDQSAISDASGAVKERRTCYRDHPHTQVNGSTLQVWRLVRASTISILSVAHITSSMMVRGYAERHGIASRGIVVVDLRRYALPRSDRPTAICEAFMNALASIRWGTRLTLRHVDADATCTVQRFISSERRLGSAHRLDSRSTPSARAVSEHHGTTNGP